MIIAIDVGNTNIVFALCKHNSILAKFRLSTDHNRTHDEYFAIISSLIIKKLDVNCNEIEGVIIASVVPSVNLTLMAFGNDHLGISPIFIDEEGSSIKVNVEGKVGADRIVDMLAASNIWPDKHLLVVDIGTTTTFDLLNSDKEYSGGVIAPGPYSTLSSFRNSTACLPQIILHKPQKVIGSTLIDAMRSGIFWGYVGLLDNIIHQIICEDKHEDIIVVGTGGYIKLFASESKFITNVDEDLTIKGLMSVYYQ